MNRLLSTSLLLLAMATPVLPAAVDIADEQDRVIFAKFLEHTDTELARLTKPHFQAIQVPEKICWEVCPIMDMALTAYELTGQPVYLEKFATALENLLSTVQTGPDGFRGWYGLPEPSLADPARPDAIISEIQTDFRVVTLMSRFTELTAPMPQFGPLRDTCRDLMSLHLVKKWDTSFVDLGKRGAIYQWNAAYKPSAARLSLPQEKVSMMIEGLLALYRATGEDEYARKAVKLGTWFKNCLELNGERYAWNRWNPAGDWDIDPANPGKWKTWLGREPRGQWHESSIRSAALLYHHGLVFDRTDMTRFANTQREVCWNGDLAAPQFFQVDGKAPQRAGERFLAPDLAPFDQALAELTYGQWAKVDRLAKKDKAWHGGVMARDWLLGKYVLLPRAQGGKQLYAEQGAQFLAKPENAQLVADLKLEVKAPGYLTPAVPPLPAMVAAP